MNMIKNKYLLLAMLGLFISASVGGIVTFFFVQPLFSSRTFILGANTGGENLPEFVAYTTQVDLVLGVVLGLSIVSLIFFSGLLIRYQDLGPKLLENKSLFIFVYAIGCVQLALTSGLCYVREAMRVCEAGWLDHMPLFSNFVLIRRYTKFELVEFVGIWLEGRAAFVGALERALILHLKGGLSVSEALIATNTNVQTVNQVRLLLGHLLFDFENKGHVVIGGDDLQGFNSTAVAVVVVLLLVTIVCGFVVFKNFELTRQLKTVVGRLDDSANTTADIVDHVQRLSEKVYPMSRNPVVRLDPGVLQDYMANWDTLGMVIEAVVNKPYALEALQQMVDRPELVDGMVATFEAQSKILSAVTDLVGNTIV